MEYLDIINLKMIIITLQGGMIMKILRREELNKMIDGSEEFTLIDVRSPESYQEEHIFHSINIPLEDIKSRAESILNKDDKIVVYCGSFDCPLSPQAAVKLTKLGFKNVYDYEGGIRDWKDGGCHVESFERARAVGE